MIANSISTSFPFFTHYQQSQTFLLASGEPRGGNDLDRDEQKNGRSPQSRSNSRRRSPVRRSRSGSPVNKGNVLYIGNLSRRVNDDDIRDHFAKYGTISVIDIVKDPYTHECRGFAFVKFELENDATDALEVDGKEIDGRKVRVEKSKREVGHTKTPGEYLGHSRSRGGGRRRSPSPRYRRRSPRGGRRSRDRYDDRRYRDHGRDRYRSRSRDRYRSRSRSGSRQRRRR